MADMQLVNSHERLLQIRVTGEHFLLYAYITFHLISHQLHHQL